MFEKMGMILKDRRWVPNLFIDKLEKDPGIALAVKPEVILFTENKRKETFNRFDLVVRMLAIEEFYGQNSFGFHLYDKMQERRVATNKRVPKDRAGGINRERFLNLITSFEQNGYVNHYPIIVNKHFELIDGSHRLALALYYRMGIIPVLTDKLHFRERVNYDLDWFKANGFTFRELERIQERQLTLMDACKKEFVAIIWPAAYQWRDQIVNELASRHQVFCTEDLFFSDEASFSHFVRRVYDLDDIASWKVDKKISIAKRFDLKCFVVKFFVSVPEYERIQVSDKYKAISLEVKKSKEKIRSDVKVKINDYFHDVIIHVSDNEYETIEINELIRGESNRMATYFPSNRIGSL
jgi:hypothetical protein